MGERPEKCTLGWLLREEDLVPFFSECSNSGRLQLSGPLKFRKGKRKKIELVFKEEKKATNAPTLAKIKSHPPKTVRKMFLSFKKQKGVGMSMGHRPWNDY